MFLIEYSQRMTDLTQVPDEDLLRRSGLGDEEAFTALYLRRHPTIYRFALHMSGSAEIAEEVTQEVFLTLIREPGRFDPLRGSLQAFLFGVARNWVLRHHSRDRMCIEMNEAVLSEAQSGEPDLLTALTRDESLERIRRAVLALPAGYREVVVLCDLEEVSYADASEILGLPVGTIRSRLNRGRSLLYGKLRVRCSV